MSAGQRRVRSRSPFARRSLSPFARRSEQESPLSKGTFSAGGVMALPFLCGRRKKDKQSRQLPDNIAASPDLNLFELLKWDPWEPEHRHQYDDDALRKRILEFPEGVAAKYEFNAGGRGSSKRYPLYKAISLGASLKTLKLMHEIFPPAMQEVSLYFRTTPLHSACAYNKSDLPLMEFIIEAYPQAVTITNKHGYTPLHVACQSGVSNPKIVELLISAYPEALALRNKLGNTPYLTAIKTPNTDPGVLALLKEQSKEELASTDIVAPSLEFNNV